MAVVSHPAREALSSLPEPRQHLTGRAPERMQFRIKVGFLNFLFKYQSVLKQNKTREEGGWVWVGWFMKCRLEYSAVNEEFLIREKMRVKD